MSVLSLQASIVAKLGNWGTTFRISSSFYHNKDNRGTKLFCSSFYYSVFYSSGPQPLGLGPVLVLESFGTGPES